MNTRILKLVSLLMLLGLVLPAFAADNAQQILPTWPQAFSLTYSDHKTFAIPVTQAGDITVTVNWEGLPVSIALKDLSGKQITALPAQNAPSAKLTYHVAAADLARGPVWFIVLTGPAGKSVVDAQTGASNVVSKGTLSATYPDVQMDKLQSAVTALQTRRASQLSTRRQSMSHTTAAVQGALTPRPQDILPADPKRAVRLATLIQSLRARITPQTNSMTGAANKRNIKQLSTDPTIYSVTPANGYPGDSVIVNAVCVSQSADNNMIRFVFNNTTTTDVKPSYAYSNSDGTVGFSVKLPPLPSGIGAVTSTGVELAANDHQPPFVTPPTSFRLDAVPIPSIISVTPNLLYQTSGSILTIKGNHLLSDTKVHYIMPNGSDVPALPGGKVSGDQMTAIGPSLTTTEPATVQVYLVNRDGKAGSPVPITMATNSFRVASTDRGEGEPGEAVLITGKGFDQPSVSFRPLSSAQISPDVRSSIGASWKISTKTDTQILAVIPDSLKGFSDTVPGVIEVYDHGFVVSTPFNMKPMYVVVPLWPEPCSWKIFDTSTTWDDYELLNTDYPDSTGKYQYEWIRGAHEASFLWGHSGTDAFSTSCVLVNNWTVDHAEVVDESLDSAGAYLDKVGINGISRVPTVWVRWWADAPLCVAGYRVTIFIRGPAGTDYEWHAPK